MHCGAARLAKEVINHVTSVGEARRRKATARATVDNSENVADAGSCGEADDGPQPAKKSENSKNI